MHLPDFARTTGFRWGVAVAAMLAAVILVLFSFIYWQVAGTIRAPIDVFLQSNAKLLLEAPPDKLLPELERRLTNDPRRVKLLGLFAKNGDRLDGNVATVPPGLRVDRTLQLTTATRLGDRGEERQQARMLGERLPDGRVLLVGHDMDQTMEMRANLERALILGLLPAVVMCILSGAVIGMRAQRRLTALRRSAERIMAGQLVERLPTRPRGDDLDQLAGIVNRMLDEIERLLTDIKGVGEDIAHDLRTPLTRVRAQLERGRQRAATREEMGTVIDRAIGGIDQAIATVMALLRITEIEHSRRQSAFGLAELVREVGELYEPIADAKGLALSVETGCDAIARGDRDLLLEAVANLVDNAVKFTPPRGAVIIALTNTARGGMVRVIDTGPGIPESDRQLVFRRFYRSDKSRHTEGVGLGLNLVAAVAKLHGFGFAITGDRPGCTVELSCWTDALASRND